MEPWCCDFMKNHVGARHERGFFVYAAPAPNGFEQPWFYLCFRALEEGQVIESVKFSTKPTTTSESCLTLASKGVIHFCPQCGVKLADFYRTDYHKFFDRTLDDFLPHPSG
jgi:hypothetical protein